jgi:hypothetical protein
MLASVVGMRFRHTDRTEQGRARGIDDSSSASTDFVSDEAAKSR